MGDLESNPNVIRTRSVVGTFIFSFIGIACCITGFLFILCIVLAEDLGRIAKSSGVEAGQVPIYSFLLLALCFLATGVLSIISCTHKASTLTNRIVAAALILAPLSLSVVGALNENEFLRIIFRVLICSGMYFPMESDTLRIMRPISIRKLEPPVKYHLDRLH
jgi:hypothetical protein